MNKRSKIIVASAGIVAINIGTLLTATIAWFTNNKVVETDGMVVRAKTDEHVQIIEKKAYTWDYLTDTAIETDNLNLEPYDCFITSRNEYARKFLRLKIKYPNGNPAGTHLVLTVECSGGLYKTSNGIQYVDTNISNLIQFKYFDNKNGEIHDTSVATLYSESKAKFTSLENAITFVSLSGTGEEQTASKPSLSVEDRTMPLETTTDSDFVTDLFIEYTYNEDLLAYYQKHAEEEFDLNVFTGSTEIEFSPDITKLLIDTTMTN